MMQENLFNVAAECIAECDAMEKANKTRAAVARWRAGELELIDDQAPAPIGEPGRPAVPQLVSPRDLPKRGFNSVQGRAALIHAIAHIEFNAINLAWDAIYRFRALPAEYYSDWLKVADEEAMHFSLLRERLRSLGYDYGDFTAHNGLWEMAQQTAHDVLVRMALVPRVLEARGLDVTPGMIKRLQAAGDQETVRLLELILRDEIGHVAIGSRWFSWLCAQRNMDPQDTFRQLLDRYMRGRIKGPFYREARLQAGFSEYELLSLEEMGLTP